MTQERQGSLDSAPPPAHDAGVSKPLSQPVESRLNESQLRELTDSLPHLFWTCLAEGACDYLSRQWIEYTGMPETDQLGYGWLMQLHPDDRERVKAEWAATVGAGVAFDIEFRIRRNDDVHRWFRTRAIPLRDTSGTIVKWYGSNSDIEDYKRTEEALQESEELSRRVIDSSNDCIEVLDLDGHLLSMSAGGQTLLGIDDLAPLLKTSWIDMWKGQEWEAARKAVSIARDGGTKLFSGYLATAKGTPKWWEVIVSPIRDGQGRVQSLLAVSRDITARANAEKALRELEERKRMEEALRESERRWRLALEGAGDGVWDWDVPTSTVFFSPRWKAMFGYAEDEIGTGLSEWSSRVHPEDMPRVMADLQPHLDGKTAVYANEHRVLCKDGGYKWILDRGMVFTRDTEGRPLRVVGTHADITERRRAEEERLRNLSLQQMMSSASPMGYLVVDNRTDEIRFFNKRFCEIWGIEHLADRMERGELKNRDIIPDCLKVLTDVPAFAASCATLQSEASRVVIDDEIPFTAGRTIRRYSTQLRGADDRDYGRFYLFEDVTRHKQELRGATHSRTMTALAGGAPLAEVLTTLVRGVEAEHSGSLGSVLLLDAAGTHLLTGAAPSLPAFYNEAIHGVAIGPTVGSCGTAAFTGERVLVADIQTDPLWTDFKAVAAQAGLAACWSEPIRSSRGRVVGTFAFYYAQPRLPGEAEINTIVTAARLAAMAIESTQANEALRESELRWQFALEGAGDGVWDSDVPSGKAFFSKRYKEMLGYAEDEIGTGISEWSSRVHPEDMPRVRAALQPHLDGKTAVYASEYRVLCKDGGYKWILDRGMVITRDAEGKPLRVVGTHADITERRQAEAEKEKLQAQLVQSQKMEAIGTLAGGIAHDFNNILAGLLGGLSLLEVEPGDLTGREADLEDMKALVERGAQLTKQLLGFARRGKYDVRPLNLGHVVAKTSAMFGSTRRDITVHLEVAPGLSAVLMDHMQMEQVLLNLFVNAGQAMAGGGRLLLRVEDVLLGPEDTGPHGAAPGQFVKLVVTDTGTGMDAETQARIFEPFFTTKEPGKGTGLGLASVYGIVKNCDGFIQVKSELGKGTTFTLFWPASDEPAAAEKPAAVTVQCGQGTILIVDDEADNLSIYARMLGKLGYDVLTAGGGKEAIALLRQHGANVSLVLLDLTMPEMSGAATYRALRELVPGVKVLLSSGYSIDGQAQELLAQGCSGFIQKPFDTRTLSAKVRECC